MVPDTDLQFQVALKALRGAVSPMRTRFHLTQSFLEARNLKP